MSLILSRRRITEKAVFFLSPPGVDNSAFGFRTNRFEPYEKSPGAETQPNCNYRRARPSSPPPPPQVESRSREKRDVSTAAATFDVSEIYDPCLSSKIT